MPAAPYFKLPRRASAAGATGRAAARDKRRRLRSFWVHLVMAIGVGIILVAANMLFDPRRLWSVLLLTGWGIALTMHGVHVFGVLPWMSADWEQSVLATLRKTLAQPPKPKPPTTPPAAQLTNQIPEAQIVPDTAQIMPPLRETPKAAPHTEPRTEPQAEPQTDAQGWASLPGWSSSVTESPNKAASGQDAPPASSPGITGEPWPQAGVPAGDSDKDSDNNAGWPAGWGR
jgi:hypothetical protein